MKTAIVGLGNIGLRLASNLAAGGEQIILSDRTLSKAESLAARLGTNAISMSVHAALEEADVIVLAIPFDTMEEFVSTRREVLAGKIIVDPSNPIEPDGNGGFRKTIPPEQSSGELIARLLPEGAELVKAFGTLGAESLESGANRTPEKAVLFYATDYPAAGLVVAELIGKSGFAPVNVGPLARSLRIEVGGDLHEFGQLGRLVSEAEAKALV